MKTATKPKVGHMTDEEHAEDTLVTDHGIDGLILHQDFDGRNLCYSGTLNVGQREVGFEAHFDVEKAWNDKVDVRALLIDGARYLDDGKSAAGHIAMNAGFKKLIKKIMADLAEQKQQTAE